MAEQNSANVFLTKSFWVPLSTMLVSKVAAGTQEWVTISDPEQDLITGGLTAIAIVIVRLLTSRQAHIIKPKE